MMESKGVRSLFTRHLVQSRPIEEFQEAPPEMLEIWRNRFEKNQAFDANELKSLSVQGRRMNNFCIGSDPEFVFVDMARGNKTNAASLGLLPGLACGCDQNQRLAELRGWPTTSALGHVAGILASLRWMYRTYPITSAFYWRAGAHFEGDGIGGHVHFGRKRPNRDQEVAGLDGLAHVMKEASFFDTAGWERRLRGEGDRLHQIYGRFGDIRPQLHGYEYRTLPSWLCSPLKAFVVLAASKLTVLDPELTAPWRTLNVQELSEGVNLLRKLSAYHAGRDDDAYLLRKLMNNSQVWTAMQSWGTPALDFKLKWGFPEAPIPIETSRPRPNILPAVIAPCKEEEAEISEFLLNGTALTYREVAPTFKNSLPPGYQWLYSEGAPDGINQGGAGDLYHDLVVYRDRTVRNNFAIRLGRRNEVSADLWNSFTTAEKQLLRELMPDVRPNSNGSNLVYINTTMLGVANISRIRQALIHSGCFPVWTVGSVQEGFYQTFMEKRKKLKASSKSPTPHERIL